MSDLEKFKNCVCGRTQEPSLKCALCQGPCCKKCVEHLPAETFSFMWKIPNELTHSQYCLACYATKVRPGLMEYNQIMKRAKQIMILDKPRRRPLTILKKFQETLQVKNCPDREETVLRLAFKAAELGFNSVIRVNVDYKKIRDEGYQHMVWQGSGIAVDLDERDLD
jgi:hypothetical protein